MRIENLVMKNNLSGLSAVLILVLFSLIYFSACQAPGNSLSPQTQDGTGYVKIIIGGVNNRTILPKNDLSHFKAFTFYFFEPGKIDPDDTDSAIVTVSRDYNGSSSSTSFTIPVDPPSTSLIPGAPDPAYDLLVKAWAGPGKLAALGRCEQITIVGGVIKEYTVNLEALPITTTGSETGSFRWQITFPAGLSSAKMTIAPADPTVTVTIPGDNPVIFSSLSATSSFTRTGSISGLSAGYYTVTFELERDERQKITYREILHIYQNLESFFPYEFKDEHFSKTIYTVTFVYNNGTPNLTPNYWHGDLINEPSPAPKKPVSAGLYQLYPPANPECTFDGWYYMGEEWDFNEEVIGDMTLTAHWSAPGLIDVSKEVGANDVIKAINYVTTIEHRGDYTLLIGASDLSANTSVNIGSGHTLPNDRNLIIKSLGAGERIIMGASGSPLFTIDGDGASLTLEKNITLFGSSSGATPLVSVTDGSLIMKDGSKITGHTTSSANGAVYVNGTDAVFEMKGGEVTGNKTAARQNDVFIGKGSFTLSNGAKIDAVTLKAADSSAFISIDSTWTGSVKILNLFAEYSDIADVSLKWKDKQVLEAATGSLTAAIVAKFTSVNFINTSGETQVINNTAPAGYLISDSGTNIGKLIENNAKAARIGLIEYPTLNAAIIAASGGSVGSPTVITLLQDITVPEIGMTANTGYIIKDNKHITLTVETDQSRAITASAGGFRLFSISDSDSSLTLEGNGTGTLTLSGNDTAATPGRQGVNVSNGTFIMNSGAAITGFKNSGTSGSFYYSGGVYLSNGTFTMNGGTINGNTGAAGDIYINTGVVYNLSGNPVIGTITLYANNSSNASVTIESGWSGSVASLNLMGNSPAMNTVIGYWYNAAAPKTVLKPPAAANTLTPADAAEFTLGNFIDSNCVAQPIGNGYCIDIRNNNGVFVKQYTVTFESNGGSPVPAQTIVQGNKVAEPQDPTRNGFDFGGWYSDATFADETTKWDFASNTVTASITLYARWQVKDIGFYPDDSPIITSSGLIIYRSGANGPTTTTLTIISGYSDVKWYYNNIELATGTSLTLDSSDIRYNMIGPKFVRVEAWKDGKPYITNVKFEVKP